MQNIRGKDEYKKKMRSPRVLLALGFIFIVIVFSQVSAVSKFFERGVAFIANPVLRGGYYVSENFTLAKIFFESKKRLQGENKKLYELLNSARISVLLYDEIQKENEELKALLGREENKGGILGIVLSSPNQSPYDVLYIDVGEEEGVYSGMPTVYDNILLGVIDVAYQDISKVKLFSSPGIETRVLIGEKKIPTIAYGRGGGEFEATLPHDVKIKNGDVISYPSLNNYIVGTVGYIESKPSSATQEIFFRAPINIFTTERVLVVPDPVVFLKDDMPI